MVFCNTLSSMCFPWSAWWCLVCVPQYTLWPDDEATFLLGTFLLWNSGASLLLSFKIKLSRYFHLLFPLFFLYRKTSIQSAISFQDMICWKPKEAEACIMQTQFGYLSSTKQSTLLSLIFFLHQFRCIFCQRWLSGSFFHWLFGEINTP